MCTWDSATIACLLRIFLHSLARPLDASQEVVTFSSRLGKAAVASPPSPLPTKMSFGGRAMWTHSAFVDIFGDAFLGRGGQAFGMVRPAEAHAAVGCGGGAASERDFTALGSAGSAACGPILPRSDAAGEGVSSVSLRLIRGCVDSITNW